MSAPRLTRACYSRNRKCPHIQNARSLAWQDLSQHSKHRRRHRHIIMHSLLYTLRPISNPRLPIYKSFVTMFKFMYIPFSFHSSSIKSSPTAFGHIGGREKPTIEEIKSYTKWNLYTGRYITGKIFNCSWIDSSTSTADEPQSTFDVATCHLSIFSSTSTFTTTSKSLFRRWHLSLSFDKLKYLSESPRHLLLATIMLS